MAYSPRFNRSYEEPIREQAKHCYHVKKVKKLVQYIAPNAKSPSKKTQRRVKATYATLLERVRWIVEISKSVRIRLGTRCIVEAPELEQFEPMAERVIDHATGVCSMGKWCRRARRYTALLNRTPN